MWTAIQQLRGGSQKKYRIFSFVLLAAFLSVPILLHSPSKGHRFGWLILTLVLFSIAAIVMSAFAWIDKRISALITFRSEKHRTLAALAGLIASCIVSGLAFRLARLPSDTIFIFVTIALLAALYYAYRSWRIVFGSIADKFQWPAATCRMFAPTIMLIGTGSLRFLGPQYGTAVLISSAGVAGGCASYKTAVSQSTEETPPPNS
jgi:hypothetical protein